MHTKLVAVRLRAIIAEACDQLGGEVLEVEVMPDHAPLPVQIPPAMPLSRVVQLVKGRSSWMLRREFPELLRMPCLWGPSWFVSTVGGAPLQVVRRHVENQKA